MEAQIEQHRFANCADGASPFLAGGWMGFLCYELGFQTEARFHRVCVPIPLPSLAAGFYLWMASHCRRTGRFFLWIHPRCSQATRTTLANWRANPAPIPAQPWKMSGKFSPTQSKDALLASVRTIKQFIQAGDVYQANLSQEFQGHYEGDPWLAFKALTSEHPTPFSAFIRHEGASILSISPERFIGIEGRRMFTSPIKGTRPRGRTPEEDVALAQELQCSEKDRAENLMIVDLLRNDLSVNAETGSVAVENLFSLESYQNVHHLVSHIHAELRDGVSPIKALMDAFPGGSITGAPKIRSMEIINELEPHWRGPYCGSVFYWGLNGRLDSNIAIRTLLCEENGTVRCWGGGGIVADSDPESEYQETLTKVKPLMDFLESL
ncbi:aminodeoxychorismate synthase component I [Marinobacter salinisoli]|nr:aminodeoxychorismate synthase component I [Marinobacter salinisoli]